MVFPVVMYGCKSWTIKKAECQIIDFFQPWCKEIKPVNAKGNQLCIFIAKTDTEAEAPIL